MYVCACLVRDQNAHMVLQRFFQSCYRCASPEMWICNWLLPCGMRFLASDRPVGSSSSSATNILRASSSPNSSYISPSDQAIAITIMHVLNRVIESDSASNQAKTKACFVLCGWPHTFSNTSKLTQRAQTTLLRTTGLSANWLSNAIL